MRYKEAGVDLDKAKKVVGILQKINPQIGEFGGLFPIDRERYLVASVDGVGTKIKIAVELGKHTGIGEDLVNHCVNDILCMGAKPLFFMDYFATGKLELDVFEQVIQGIDVATKAHNMVLLGGETAEMPGYYEGGEYELAGFIVGEVNRNDRLPKRQKIKPGDLVIGFSSSGLHTNGYSLVRKIIADGKLSLDKYYDEIGNTLGDELLKVHRSYFFLYPYLSHIKAIAHVTGGGLYDNLIRVLPEGLGAKIKKIWPIPPIFNLIMEYGNVSEEEMFRVFNMGIGMVAVMDQTDISILENKLDEKFYVIGEIIDRPGVWIE